MTYTVTISGQAMDELDAAFAWLVERTQQHAYTWYNHVLDSILSLEQFPARCPLAPENERHHEEVRHLIVGNRIHAYRIVFVIRKESVIVLDILHGARDKTN